MIHPYRDNRDMPFFSKTLYISIAPFLKIYYLLKYHALHYIHLLFSKKTYNKKKNNLADTESYSKYLASLIFERQVKLYDQVDGSKKASKSKKDKVVSLIKNISTHNKKNACFFSLYNVPNKDRCTSRKKQTPIHPTVFKTNRVTEEYSDDLFTVNLNSKFLIRFISILQIIFAVSANNVTGQTSIVKDVKSLEIGDTIPEALWNLPLQVVNHSEKKNNIFLKDHKSKVIIIDFWSTYCGACIEGFPKFIELQKKYGEKIVFIPVTYQQDNHISKAIATNPYFEGLENPIVVNDSILHKYFKHLTIPHVVWIDPSGKVQGFTTAHHVISTYIDELLIGKKSHWATKIEDKELLTSPIVAITGEPTSDATMSSLSPQYSFLKGFQSGLPLYNVYINDNINDQTKLVRYANHAIFNLYMRALGRYVNPVYRSLLVFENVDPTTIQYFTGTGVSADNWHEKYAVTYESRMPLNANVKDASKKLLSDLNFFLNMNVRFEDRELNSWSLKIIDQNLFNKKSKTNGGTAIEKLITKDREKVIKNIPLSKLINALNYLGAPEPVINQTNYHGDVDITLNVDDMLDFDQLNKALISYGLSMIKEKNKVNVLVFESLIK